MFRLVILSLVLVPLISLVWLIISSFFMVIGLVILVIVVLLLLLLFSRVSIAIIVFIIADLRGHVNISP